MIIIKLNKEPSTDSNHRKEFKRMKKIIYELIMESGYMKTRPTSEEMERKEFINQVSTGLNSFTDKNEALQELEKYENTCEFKSDKWYEVTRYQLEANLYEVDDEEGDEIDGEYIETLEIITAENDIESLNGHKFLLSKLDKLHEGFDEDEIEEARKYWGAPDDCETLEDIAEWWNENKMEEENHELYILRI